MNEKIRELAERSGFMDTWFSESAEVDVEKFARLIVEDEVMFLELVIIMKMRYPLPNEGM